MVFKDNFAHDVIRYNLDTLDPYQEVTAIDKFGDFEELYEPLTDPLILRFCEYRRRAGHMSPLLTPAVRSRTLRSLRNILPFAPNMSPPEFVPTRLLTFLEILREKFPLHRLLLSDFSSLPDTIPGHNAPVVQTMYQGTMVPCSTFKVQPGYFDIFFPTSFGLLRDMYEHVMSRPLPSDFAGTRPSPLATAASPLQAGAGFFSSSDHRRPLLDGLNSSSGLTVGSRKSKIFSHRHFLEKYADLHATTLRNGSNPMLSFYQNVHFLF